MERRTLVLLILAAVIVSGAAAWLTLAGMPFGRRHATAPPQTVEQAVAPFQAIRIRGATEVTLVQGSAPSVRIETNGHVGASARVVDGTLVVTSGDERRTWQRFFNRAPRVRPRVTITFVDLARLEVSGSVRARAAAIKAPHLAIEVSGAGTLDFALQSIADYYNKIIPRRIKVVFAVFNPVMMLSLIAVVGLVALAVILPILQLWNAR